MGGDGRTMSELGFSSDGSADRRAPDTPPTTCHMHAQVPEQKNGRGHMPPDVAERIPRVRGWRMTWLPVPRS